MMKFYQIVSLSSLLLVSVVGVKSGSNTRQQQQVPLAVPSGSSNTYSQPMTPGYVQPAASTRQETYAYSQPMMAQASTQADYYQPVEPVYGGPGAGYGGNGGYGHHGYARHHVAPTGAQPAYYEPIHQGSGHYPIKRGHGYGWHPQVGIESILFIGIPLIILPLLFIYPYFLYAAGHHSHPVVYAGGWKRSGDGKAPVVEDAKKKKTDELTEKIVPKLDKAS